MDNKSSNEKVKICIKMMRQLVSEIQGAPYPSENFEAELYKIWYEHVQKAAVECFEYLDSNFPVAKNNFKGLDEFITNGKSKENA